MESDAVNERNELMNNDIGTIANFLDSFNNFRNRLFKFLVIRGLLKICNQS